jgi:6-phosphogluconolactonase
MLLFQLRSLPCPEPGGSARPIAAGLLAALLASCSSGGGGGGAPAKAYTIGTRVTGLADVTGLELQDNGADTLTIASSGNYSFTTQISSGASYSVTILSQAAGHTCAVQDGSGTVASSDVTVVVVCPWHVGYAPASQGVLAYYIDQSTGATTALPGAPFTAGSNPSAIAVSPATQFLYVTNQGDGTVSGFLIDPTSGALSPMAGSPFTAGSAPVAIAVDGNGKFVYVANSGSSDISAFIVDSSTGALTAVANSPFGMTGNPVAIAVDSTGNYVYAYYSVGNATPSSSASASVSGFAIDATTGALTAVPASPFIINPSGTGSYPTSFAVDPTAGFLYIGFTDLISLAFAGGSYATESIDPASGVLAAVAGSPSAAPGPVGSIAIDPAGKFFYAGNPYEGDVFGFTIDASSGLLTAIAGNGPAVDNAIVDSVDPSGRFLYAVYPAHESVSFPIDPATGALGPVTLGPANATLVAFSSTP